MACLLEPSDQFRLMIYFVTLQPHAGFDKVTRALRPEVDYIRCITYERLFRDRRAPVAHFVLADLDRLNQYELEAVVAMSDALRSADPGVRILNDPRHLLERYPLLRTLEREGINRFQVTRLDGGDRPSRYPVFIRSEDNHLGVDTELLHNDDEFVAAIANLRRQGKVLKRRIAVEFCAVPNEDGLYRKYGIINVDGEMIPQHVLHNEHWLVKRRSRGRTTDDFEEDLNFVRENPHADQVRRIFQLAHIDYGRADYTVIDGRVQIYEINTNPNLPGLSGRRGDDHPARRERRSLTRERFVRAFDRLNTPVQSRPPVTFELTAPRYLFSPWLPLRRRMLLELLARYPSFRAVVPRRYW